MAELRNCGNCKYFLSYRDEYEDEMEPTDSGTCLFPDNKCIEDINVIDEDTCDNFKPSSE